MDFENLKGNRMTVLSFIMVIVLGFLGGWFVGDGLIKKDGAKFVLGAVLMFFAFLI